MDKLSEYKANEQHNAHSENALLLAELFGSESERERVKHVLWTRSRLGYVTQADADFQASLSRRYFPILRAFPSGFVPGYLKPLLH